MSWVTSTQPVDGWMRTDFTPAATWAPLAWMEGWPSSSGRNRITAPETTVCSAGIGPVWWLCAAVAAVAPSRAAMTAVRVLRIGGLPVRGGGGGRRENGFCFLWNVCDRHRPPLE